MELGIKNRAFVCIDFPDEVIKEVTRVQKLIGNLKFTGKLTELENLHLTLKFLGEIDEEKLERVRKKLRGIKFESFEVKLGDVGTFNFKGKPRIVWIKLLGKGLFNSQAKIDSVLEEEGFVKEERFMSHMTIARVRYVKDKEGFNKHIKGIKLKDIRFRINEFKLMKSELRSLGPVYSLIEKYAS